MKVHGRCCYGGIAYETEVKSGAVNICHCQDGQTLSSAAFRVNPAAPGLFRRSGESDLRVGVLAEEKNSGRDAGKFWTKRCSACSSLGCRCSRQIGPYPGCL